MTFEECLEIMEKAVRDYNEAVAMIVQHGLTINVDMSSDRVSIYEFHLSKRRAGFSANPPMPKVKP